MWRVIKYLLVEHDEVHHPARASPMQGRVGKAML